MWGVFFQTKVKGEKMFYKPNFYKDDYVSFHKPGHKKKAAWISKDKKSREICSCLASALGDVKAIDFDFDKKGLESLYTYFQEYFLRRRKRLALLRHQEALFDNDIKEIDLFSNVIDGLDASLFLPRKFFNHEESPEYKRTFMRLVHGGLELAIDRASCDLLEVTKEPRNLDFSLSFARLTGTQEAKKLVEDWLFLEKEANREKVDIFFKYPEKPKTKPKPKIKTKTKRASCSL